ncbi:MAG: hypothetical protein KGY80_10470 [Candidatus Thorarchaeota archaeon]|nr:hypothetical protein [Candidatus Thorarchaeota archaeon]
MARSKKVIKGAVGHLALFVLNFFVLVGVIESLQLFNENLPFLNVLLLGYMLIHTFSLLSIQLGIQILELIRIRMPTFLPTYYFQFSDEEAIPIPLLDPTKSKLAVLIILLVISGGVILYPIFAIYGFFLTQAHLLVIALEPAVILDYFGIFLNWMPPIIAFIVAIVILSIVAVEFRHM